MLPPCRLYQFVGRERWDEWSETRSHGDRRVLPDHGAFESNGLILRIHELLQPALGSEEVLHQLTGEPSEGIAVQTSQSGSDVCWNGHGHEVLAWVDRIDQWNVDHVCLLVVSCKGQRLIREVEGPSRTIPQFTAPAPSNVVQVSLNGWNILSKPLGLYRQPSDRMSSVPSRERERSIERTREENHRSTECVGDMKAMHGVVDLATVAATFVDAAGYTLDVSAWLGRVLQGVQSCLHQC